MPYSNKTFQETNVNYLNKDFLTLKTSLIEYAKTYFPNSYKDFNESSPGMMLIEMAAYVGDVLSFYVDQQYREMMLPLAEEKKNIINIAQMLGYKPKPSVPSYVNLKFTQTVDATGDTDAKVPDATQYVTVDKGLQVTSVSNTDIVFETLDVVDFKTSGSHTPPNVQSAWDGNGLVTSFDVTRYVRAVSGETKSTGFTVGTPTKFLELTISETNVIEIIDVYDSANNRWYEVDYLAQDRIPIETHYSSDSSRQNDDDSYSDINNTNGNALDTVVTVPYSLKYNKTSKRFVTQVNEDNTTSLVFGNGILRPGQSLESTYLNVEQVGLTIPGTAANLNSSIDSLLGDEYSTLGETPAHTNLTVRYRVGGGIVSNVASVDVTSLGTPSYLGSPSSATLAVTNDDPARGGSAQQSVNEIRERAKAFFATQNRCVTKEDYEARAMALPAKFGNIAKVYVSRLGVNQGIGADSQSKAALDKVNSIINDVIGAAITTANMAPGTTRNLALLNMWENLDFDVNADGTVNSEDLEQALQFLPQPSADGEIPTIEIWTLAYDGNKNLTRLSDNSDGTAHLIHSNLKKYLENFRLITDEVVIRSGYVINFGVIFDVTAHKTSNKQEVKIACIQKIIDYFAPDNMNFREPIYVSQLQYELLGVDGVRGVNHVTVTQGNDYTTGQGVATFNPQLYEYAWDPQGGTGNQGAWSSQTGEGQGRSGYGYYFNFHGAQSSDGSVIRPPATPSVFELKDPTSNVKGIVR